VFEWWCGEDVLGFISQDGEVRRERGSSRRMVVLGQRRGGGSRLAARRTSPCVNDDALSELFEAMAF